MRSSNSFLQKFKGKVNKVSKLGLKQLILHDKTKRFQSFQQNTDSVEYKKKQRRLSLTSGKMHKQPSAQGSSQSLEAEEKKIQKSKSVSEIKMKYAQKLPKICGQNQIQRRLSLQSKGRQATKSELRINKVIKNATFQTNSKYKSWKTPIDVSEDNLRFFKFTTGMSKLKSRQASNL